MVSSVLWHRIQTMSWTNKDVFRHAIPFSISQTHSHRHPANMRGDFIQSDKKTHNSLILFNQIQIKTPVNVWINKSKRVSKNNISLPLSFVFLYSFVRLLLQNQLGTPLYMIWLDISKQIYICRADAMEPARLRTSNGGLLITSFTVTGQESLIQK